MAENEVKKVQNAFAHKMSPHGVRMVRSFSEYLFMNYCLPDKKHHKHWKQIK